MAVWELALLLVAITYLMVNTVYLIMQVKLMNKMNGIYDKGIKLAETLLEKYEPFIKKLFDEMDDF